MKTTHIFIFAALMLGGLVGTPLAHAQTVTDTSVTRLSDTVTMYTITYELGFLNADLWVPLAAGRAETTKGVSYESAATKSYAVVLSAEELTDDKQYYVPKGKRGTFTLVVLEELIGPATKEAKRVRVTKLPHIIEREGEKKQVRTLLEADLTEFVVPK